MIQHPMRYVQMSQKVRDELGGSPLTSHAALALSLERGEEALVHAEMQVVEAYGRFRGLLEMAADAGSEKAKHYLEVTWWDLT